MQRAANATAWAEENMAMPPTGVVVQNGTTGDYEVGVDTATVSTLTVNGGDDLNMTATNLNVEPHLRIGSGDQPANGTVTVTGAGSTITMTGEGTTAADGVSLAVGENGGHGVLNVLAGSTFKIED